MSSEGSRGDREGREVLQDGGCRPTWVVPTQIAVMPPMYYAIATVDEPTIAVFVDAEIMH